MQELFIAKYVFVRFN